MTYEKLANVQTYLKRKRIEVLKIKDLQKANRRLHRIMKMSNIMMEMQIELNNKAFDEMFSNSLVVEEKPVVIKPVNFRPNKIDQVLLNIISRKKIDLNTADILRYAIYLFAVDELGLDLTRKIIAESHYE